MNEHGGKWRGLPEQFGPWGTIYQRWYRWNHRGLLAVVFQYLQEAGLMLVESEVIALDSTSVKVHPDGTGASKNTAGKPWASLTAAATPKYT